MKKKWGIPAIAAAAVLFGALARAQDLESSAAQAENLSMPDLAQIQAQARQIAPQQPTSAVPMNLKTKLSIQELGKLEALAAKNLAQARKDPAQLGYNAAEPQGILQFRIYHSFVPFIAPGSEKSAYLMVFARKSLDTTQTLYSFIINPDGTISAAALNGKDSPLSNPEMQRAIQRETSFWTDYAARLGL